MGRLRAAVPKARIDPTRLAKYGFTFDQVTTAIREN